MSVPLKAHRVVVNALSIDVEDYFQVWALARWIPRAKWDETPCRVEQNLDVILRLLDDAGAQATFFTLGWIAERFPDSCGASPQPGTRSRAMATPTPGSTSSTARRSSPTSCSRNRFSRTSRASR